MWRIVLRIYYYLATACALVYETIVLQNIVHDLLLHIGLTDATSLAGLLDLIGNLPVFSSVWVDGLVLLFGIAHYVLLARDRATAIEGEEDAVRGFFLAVLTVAFGLRVVYELVLIIQYIDHLSGGAALPVAAPLAAVIAWAIALALVLVEWGLGEALAARGQVVAKLVALVGQWILLTATVAALARLIQAILQQWLDPLPECATAADLFSFVVTLIIRLANQCTDLPSPLGGALTFVVVAAAFILYERWAARYDVSWLADCDAFVGTLIPAFIFTLSAVVGIRFVIDSVTGVSAAQFPRSLVSTPSDFGVGSYAFVGPLVASLCLLGFYLWRVWHGIDDEANFYSLALTYPFAIAFYVGGSLLLGHVISTVLYNRGIVLIPVADDSWRFALSLFIPGMLGSLLLWREHRSLGSRGVIITPSTSIYRMSYFICLAGTAVISFLIFVALIALPQLGVSLDTTHYFTAHIIAFTLVTTPAALHYNRLRSSDM